MADVTCSVGGCAKEAKAGSLCWMHYKRQWRARPRRKPPTVEERFWPKVDRRGPDECWNWTASKHRAGYGQFMLNRRPQGAHRVAYELLVGPIPEGLTLDHLCRNPSCVNPAHLEPVTLAENVARSTWPAAVNARKTHCIHGHEFTPENTYYKPDGSGRDCRTCSRERQERLRDLERPDRLPPPGLRTHCPRGHAYDEENTHWNKGGGRSCRACHRERERERRRARNRALCGSAPGDIPRAASAG